MGFPQRKPLAALAMAVCLLSAGCGKNGPATKPVHGTVTCGGDRVATGQLFFVPLDGVGGRNCAVAIVDGQYRIEAHGGAPLGKYRVCLDTRKKTGRKVQGYNGMEQALIDETVRVGPEAYAGDQSPLVVDITADFNGQFDIAIPQ